VVGNFYASATVRKVHWCTNARTAQTQCLYVHPWSYTESSVTRCLINCLCEFHGIYNFSVAGDKDELIRYCGQKFNGHSHSETKGTFSTMAYQLTVCCERLSSLYWKSQLVFFKCKTVYICRSSSCLTDFKWHHLVNYVLFLDNGCCSAEGRRWQWTCSCWQQFFCRSQQAGVRHIEKVSEEG